MRGFHRIAFIGIENEPVWPENRNGRHYSPTFSMDIHYRGRCPQAVVSAPFPPSCRCRQNGGQKQNLLLSLLWSVNSYLAPYGGLCAPHRVTTQYAAIFSPRAPSVPGQLSFSDPPLPCASCAFPLPRACGCPAPGTCGVTFGGAFQLLTRGPCSLWFPAVRESILFSIVNNVKK